MIIKKRFYRVAILFLKIVLDFRKEFILIKKRGYKYAQKRMGKVHEKRAKQLYDTAVSLGGALIKLCQYFSARRDIFPESYIRILTPLQDNVPPIEFEIIEETLQREYGDYKKYFKEIKKDSLASASLAQVHLATLNNGEEVVIKILKPGIERIIDIDFAILFHIFRLMSNFKIFKERADFYTVLEEFIRVTGDELNFKREIYIAKEFRKNFEKFEYIRIPYIYEKYCTKKIIVMEYLRGDKINEVDMWNKRNNDPVILSKRVIELYIEQLLYLPLLHFDPHPGNILISDNNNIILLDFGMAGEISLKMRNGLQDALKAFLKKDYRKIIDVLDNLGFIQKGINKYLLIPIIEFLFDEILEVVKLERESIYNTDLSPIIDNLVEIIYSQPFNLPVEWAYIGKTISTLIGIISILNPDFKIYEEFKPHAERLLKMNYNEIIDRTYESVKSNVNILLGLPGKIDNFINNLEQGYYKIKVDYTEIKDKIDVTQVFLLKLFSFFIFSISAVCSYIFYFSGQKNIFYLFLIISCLSLMFFLGYKKRSVKDRIKKYF